MRFYSDSLKVLLKGKNYCLCATNRGGGFLARSFLLVQSWHRHHRSGTGPSRPPLQKPGTCGSGSLFSALRHSPFPHHTGMECGNLVVFSEVYLICYRIWLHLLMWCKGKTSDVSTGDFTHQILMKSLSHSLIPTSLQELTL